MVASIDLDRETEKDSDLDTLTFLILEPPGLTDEDSRVCVSPHEGSTALKSECCCSGDRGVVGGQQSWKTSTRARKMSTASQC